MTRVVFAHNAASLPLLCMWHHVINLSSAISFLSLPATTCASGDTIRHAERIGYDGDCPEDVAPSHEFRPKARDGPVRKDHTEQHLAITSGEPSGSPQQQSPTPKTQEAEGDKMQVQEHSLSGMEPDVSICRTDKAVKEEERCSETQSIPVVDDDTAKTCNLPSEACQQATTVCSQPSTLGDVPHDANQKTEGVGFAPFPRQTGEAALRGSRCCSTSASDSSSSSGSSVSSVEGCSCYNGDAGENASGILEDFTEGVDSWLEDVHGAGREAFFQLFKLDATPQFCRPSLEVIGRHVSTL